jgi:hypothetical protein
MATTERTTFFIGILDDGQIEFRRTRQFLENGEVLGERHHRQVLEPGQDVSSFPNKLRQITAIIWTPQVIADYLAFKASKNLIR